MKQQNSIAELLAGLGVNTIRTLGASRNIGAQYQAELSNQNSNPWLCVF
jgi:hypothetical protein